MEDVLLSLSLFLFPFTLKKEDGWGHKGAGAGGEEAGEQKCFQRETFYLAFFTECCKTYTYFKWKDKFKRPGNVLSGDKLAPAARLLPIPLLSRETAHPILVWSEKER